VRKGTGKHGQPKHCRLVEHSDHYWALCYSRNSIARGFKEFFRKRGQAEPMVSRDVVNPDFFLWEAHVSGRREG